MNIKPEWYGMRYPTPQDLEELAFALGAAVMESPLEVATFTPPLFEGGIPVIGVPADAGPLERVWLLCHELGHLLQHAGPRGELLYGKDERQADRWAACALIPERRIRQHLNASEDAFVAALSRHYEDLPPERCPARALAGRIARIRLQELRRGAA